MNALQRMGTIALAALCLLFTPIAPAEAQEDLVLTFAGDCTLGTEGRRHYYAHGFVQTILKKGFDWPFSGVQALFSGDDLTLVNLEGTFTDRKQTEKEKFAFRAPPAFAEILLRGSVEAVNLANNHTLDYGEDGLSDTMAALDAQGVAYCTQAQSTVVEARGHRIALLGICYPLRAVWLEALYAEIDAYRAREDIDLIVVSFHWGIEMSYVYREDQMLAARGAIDHGADAVIGTHPHVLQGMELYHGKPIFYSLGNFSFGGNISPMDFDTAVAQVAFDLTGDGPRLARLQVFPCSISKQPLGTYQDFRPVFVSGEDAERVLEKLSQGAQGLPDTFFQEGIWVAENAAEER